MFEHILGNYGAFSLLYECKLHKIRNFKFSENLRPKRLLIDLCLLKHLAHVKWMATCKLIMNKNKPYIKLPLYISFFFFFFFFCCFKNLRKKDDRDENWLSFKKPVSKINHVQLHIEIKWAASSEFGTYRLCEQRRFRRACASAQSRQNLRCSLIQAVSQEEPSDRKPDPWPLWMAGHAQLKFVMTECSKAQIRLTRSK